MTQAARRQRQALLYALLAVGCWSTVATAFKISLGYLDVLNLVCWASLSSTVCLGVLLAVRGRLPGALRDMRSGPVMRQSLLLGAINPLGYYLVLMEAYDRLPAQLAQPLNYTWPIALSLMGVLFLGQRMRLANLLAILVSFCGVVLISSRGSAQAFAQTDMIGILLALGSSLFWASYWIINRRDTREPVARLFAGFVWGTILAFGLALALGRLQVPALPALAGAAYIGLFEMGLTFVFWMRAMELAQQPAIVNNLAFLSPFLSLVLIALVLGEQILPSTVLGLVLIVAGIVLQARAGQKTAQNA